MKTRRAAFSLVELLVTAAIGAAVLTAGVLIYQNLVNSGAATTAYDTITVDGASFEAYFAPSYGRAALAESVREQFLEDLDRAVAVFCLGREQANTVHPATIAVGADFRGDLCATPAQFREVLAAAVPLAATVFPEGVSQGAYDATNASIFILVRGSSANALTVLAVYDVDFRAATSSTTAGVYASVRRVENGEVTNAYDVFYPDTAGTIPFRPLVVAFERAVRTVGDPVADRFRIAAGRPFYFLFWPDPTEPSLEAVSAATFDATDPRVDYAAMGDRTAFFFVVPMFPAL